MGNTRRMHLALLPSCVVLLLANDAQQLRVSCLDFLPPIHVTRRHSKKRLVRGNADSPYPRANRLRSGNAETVPRTDPQPTRFHRRYCQKRPKYSHPHALFQLASLCLHSLSVTPPHRSAPLRPKVLNRYCCRESRSDGIPLPTWCRIHSSPVLRAKSHHDHRSIRLRLRIPPATTLAPSSLTNTSRKAPAISRRD